jgi:AraC-like DNA-binding protein
VEDALIQRFDAQILAEPDWSIARHAKALGISQRGLRDRCRAHYGVPPKRYAIMRRLEAVRALLLTGKTNVTRAAHEFGFYELARFARLYRATFGEQPSATRRRHAV